MPIKPKTHLKINRSTYKPYEIKVTNSISTVLSYNQKSLRYNLFDQLPVITLDGGQSGKYIH